MSSDFNLRLVLGKIKVDEELCTKCGTCEKMCPTNAIKLDPFPVISNKCTGCVGCINLCPSGALNSSSTKNKQQYKFDPSTSTDTQHLFRFDKRFGSSVTYGVDYANSDTNNIDVYSTYQLDPSVT